MPKFMVEVLWEEANGKSCYLVDADTERDAMQIAFALDGGWSVDNSPDATGMLELAKMYCKVIRRNEPPNAQHLLIDP